MERRRINYIKAQGQTDATHLGEFAITRTMSVYDHRVAKVHIPDSREIIVKFIDEPRLLRYNLSQTF